MDVVTAVAPDTGASPGALRVILRRVLAADSDPGMRLLMPGKSLRAMTEGNRRLYTDQAGSVTRGEYRPLEGARHSTLTTDRPDDVVRAVRDLHWTILH
jgi:hypothetical protein